MACTHTLLSLSAVGAILSHSVVISTSHTHNDSVLSLREEKPISTHTRRERENCTMLTTRGARLLSLSALSIDLWISGVNNPLLYYHQFSLLHSMRMTINHELRATRTRGNKSLGSVESSLVMKSWNDELFLSFFLFLQSVLQATQQQDGVVVGTSGDVVASPQPPPSMASSTAGSGNHLHPLQHQQHSSSFITKRQGVSGESSDPHRQQQLSPAPVRPSPVHEKDFR